MLVFVQAKMTKMWEYFFSNDSPGNFPQGSCSYQTNPIVQSMHSSQETSVLGLLLKSGSVAQTTPKHTMTSPMTRTVFKQQLQRQQLEQLEQCEKRRTQPLQTVQETPSIAVPANTLPNSAPGIPEVPTSVLQVCF